MEEIPVNESDDLHSFLDVELEALQSIYVNEITVIKNELNSTSVSIDLYPATADNLHEQYVRMTLKFTLKEEYPEELPEINIRNPRGLSEEKLRCITEDLLSIAENKKGNSMLFEMIEAAKEHLTAENRPSGECAICLYGFNEDDVFTRTECYHYFHSHCLARYSKNALENNEETNAEARASNFQLLCPMCRIPIQFEGSEDLFPPPLAADDDTFIMSEEILELQKKMAELFQHQVEKGGIIDIEAEKNKYLLEISHVPTRTNTGEKVNSKASEDSSDKVANQIEEAESAVPQPPDREKIHPKKDKAKSTSSNKYEGRNDRYNRRYNKQSGRNYQDNQYSENSGSRDRYRNRYDKGYSKQKPYSNQSVQNKNSVEGSNDRLNEIHTDETAEENSAEFRDAILDDAKSNTESETSLREDSSNVPFNKKCDQKVKNFDSPKRHNERYGRGNYHNSQDYSYNRRLPYAASAAHNFRERNSYQSYHKSNYHQYNRYQSVKNDPSYESRENENSSSVSENYRTSERNKTFHERRGKKEEDYRSKKDFATEDTFEKQSKFNEYDRDSRSKSAYSEEQYTDRHSYSESQTGQTNRKTTFVEENCPEGENLDTEEKEHGYRQKNPSNYNMRNSRYRGRGGHFSGYRNRDSFSDGNYSTNSSNYKKEKYPKRNWNESHHQKDKHSTRGEKSERYQNAFGRNRNSQGNCSMSDHDTKAASENIVESSVVGMPSVSSRETELLVGECISDELSNSSHEKSSICVEATSANNESASFVPESSTFMLQNSLTMLPAPPGFANPLKKVIYGLQAANPPPGFHRS